MIQIDPQTLFCGNYEKFISAISSNLANIDSDNKFYRLHYMSSTTNYKLKTAEYHFNRMLSLFKEGSFGTLENQQQIRAEIDAFFFSLKSALDLLAQEIKIVFSIGDVPENKVDIQKIREKLVSLSEPIGRFLSDEMNKNWFSDFKLYRDVTSHRNIPIMSVRLIFADSGTLSKKITEKYEELKNYISEEELKKEFEKLTRINLVENHFREIYLRNDPTNLAPQADCNRELFSDCLSNLIIVRAIIRNSYDFFNEKV